MPASCRSAEAEAAPHGTHNCGGEQHRRCAGNSARVLALIVVASFGVAYTWSGDTSVGVLHLSVQKHKDQ